MNAALISNIAKARSFKRVQNLLAPNPNEIISFSVTFKPHRDAQPGFPPIVNVGILERMEPRYLEFGRIKSEYGLRFRSSGFVQATDEIHPDCSPIYKKAGLELRPLRPKIVDSLPCSPVTLHFNGFAPPVIGATEQIFAISEDALIGQGFFVKQLTQDASRIVSAELVVRGSCWEKSTRFLFTPHGRANGIPFVEVAK